jgi:heme A synthase
VTTTATTEQAPRSTLFTVLIGLTSLAILLQGVWAGMFVRSGKANDKTWVHVHARGAEVAIALAIVALVVAVVRLRSRRDLVAGTAAFVVLLVLEAFIGGLVVHHETLEVIHFPLALALVGLAVWIPLRSRR